MVEPPTLYDIMADLRARHPTPAAARTLDMVSTELGVTRDNLRDAIRNVNARPLPPGGRQVLDELWRRARAAEVEDLDYGPEPDVPGDVVVERLDEGQAGIGALLLVSSVLVVALGVFAILVGLNGFLHFH